MYSISLKNVSIAVLPFTRSFFTLEHAKENGNRRTEVTVHLFTVSKFLFTDLRLLPKCELNYCTRYVCTMVARNQEYVSGKRTNG